MLEYRNNNDELSNMNKQVLSNISIIHLKRKEYKDVVKFANDVRINLRSYFLYYRL